MPILNRARRSRASHGTVAILAACAITVPAVAFAGTVAVADEVDCTMVPWMDTSLSAEERADALVEASSQHQIYRWLVEQPANDPDRTNWNPGFAGEDPVVYPAQVDCTPDVVYVNGPEGLHNTAGSTAWPAPIAQAATWAPDLAVDKGAAMADEAFDKRKNVILGPGINSARTPLSGRNSEYFGEDAVLSGLTAAATVRGIEDEGDPTKPVFANVKHYVANEQETDRAASSSNMSERVLREIYSLPFEIAVERSDAGSVMCSYNQINGVYACENPILTSVLKDDAGFDGYVMSDFGSVHSTSASLNAGMDQELNRPIWFTPTRLDAALDAGEITQEMIVGAAKRVITTYIGKGLFDHALPAQAVADVSSDEHKSLARSIAEQGTVLLKNDEVLPFDTAEIGSIGVFGSTASMAGNGPADAADACASFIPFGGGFPTLNCDEVVAPDTAITERAASDGISVSFNDGTDLASVTAEAAAVDVAVVFGHYAMGEFSDIDDIRLDHAGDELIAAVAAGNDNTVVVLQTGGPVEMPWIDDVSAVFEAWYAGEQVGPAIAGLLFGDVSPSGKLPVTFPVSLDDTPAAQSDAQFPGIVDASGIRQVDYSEGLSVGYRWYEEQGIEPLFPFGHGLTYTDFKYSKLKVTPSKLSANKEVKVKFRLTNTGDTVATEVAQVYIELPASAGEPSKRLAAWDRVTVEPGKHKNVQIRLSEADLEDLHLLDYYDENEGAWVTPKGTFTVHVGGSIDTDLDDTFSIAKKVKQEHDHKDKGKSHGSNKSHGNDKSHGKAWSEGGR